MSKHIDSAVNTAKNLSRIHKTTLYVNKPAEVFQGCHVQIEKEFSEYRTYFVVCNGEVVEDRRKQLSTS